MKGNYETLADFGTEIERIQKSARDYRAPIGGIQMVGDEQLEISGAGSFGIQKAAHGQIAEKLGIPKPYYDRMAEIPQLRTINVNNWISKTAFDDPKRKQFVRTLDGNARAFLSDGFRPIDNYDILYALLPALHEARNRMEIKVHSQSITPEKMYLQLMFPGLSGEVRAGDRVSAGITVSNSEIGYGSFRVDGWIYRYVCSNGLIMGKHILKQNHIGRRLGDEIDPGLFRDDTRKAEMVAYSKMIRDVFANMIKGEWFEESLADMRKAVGDQIADPVTFSERMFKAELVTKEESRSILLDLSRNGELNRWGVVNSITAMAHEIENVQKQYDYEALGGKILALPTAEWEALTI